MKRLVALLMGIWLGVQWGACVVSVVLFNSHAVAKTLASSMMNTLFYIASSLGLVVWALVLMAYRGNPYSGKRLRRWVWIMWSSLWVAVLINSVVASHGQSFLAHFLGGSLGLWRGGLHLWHIGVAGLGLVLCGRLLRWDSRLD